MKKETRYPKDSICGTSRQGSAILKMRWLTETVCVFILDEKGNKPVQHNSFSQAIYALEQINKKEASQ